MTSNRPVDEWGKLLGDVPAAGAILDRLLHRAEVIAINGRSHRLAAGIADTAPSERPPTKTKPNRGNQRTTASDTARLGPFKRLFAEPFRLPTPIPQTAA